MPLSILAFLLVPPNLDSASRTNQQLTHRQKLYQLDLIGALAIALFLILFVFSLTEGNRVGWATARALVPLLLGVDVVLPAFMIWEEWGRTRRGYEACLPLKLWSMGDFTVLFLASLVSFYCYGAVYITFTTLWSGPGFTCGHTGFERVGDKRWADSMGRLALAAGKVLPPDRHSDHATSRSYSHPRRQVRSVSTASL